MNDKKRVPAPKCLICDKKIEEVGGRRLLGSSLRGVALSPKYLGGGNKDYPHKSVKLREGEETYVTIWGERDVFTSQILEKAKDQFLKGFTPWFCQHCGLRTCSECGEPISLPVGYNHLGETGCGGHCPPLGVNIRCKNKNCKKH